MHPTDCVSEQPGPSEWHLSACLCVCVCERVGVPVCMEVNRAPY